MQRIFDICFASIALILLSPFFLLIVMVIKLESKGPAIFKQKRVGKDMRPYFIYKFRSMVVHDFLPEELGPIKHNHNLVTRSGHFLRRTKLDEIPQFFNVLKGDMRIVGPRPCLFSTLETLTDTEKRRFKVLPGLTGWAEINGNVELSWREQLTLDLWYVDHYSFRLDLKIIYKTILTVLFGSIRNIHALSQAEIYLENANGKSERDFN